MNDYHLNFFRPYSDNCRNEMSVTRAFIIACAKSPNGTAFLQEVLNKAGIEVSFAQDNPRFGLEVSGGTHNTEFESKIKAVLCISPDESIAHDGILAGLYSSPPEVLAKFKTVVRSDDEQADLDKLKSSLFETFPVIRDVLANKNEVESASILSAAWWDIWRLLYAGARVDALIQSSTLLCLIESKIWGSVYEVQARNHAQEFFGTTQISMDAVSWQQVYDIAMSYHDDAIIFDFAEYLSEFPQLARWNGYDGLDMRSFEINAGNLEPEPVLQNRLQSRFWQSMEELCSKFDYDVFARRGDDWDFTPKGFKLLGNTGIGYWGSCALSAKWCVGYHAWEMDEIMKHPDLAQRGEAACVKLATALEASRIRHGLSVEMRAVQRFQYINASDGTWFDASSISISDISDLAAALKKLWKQEVDLLMSYHGRRGEEVSASEALEIKKKIYRMREPDEKELPDSMATRHKTWQLFAAFDLFVNIEPNVFGDSLTQSFMPRTEQLIEMDRIVCALAQFAETISG